MAGLGVGAGANLVGGLMQSVAGSMANRAMDEAFKREIGRQNAFRNEAFGVFQPSVQLRGSEEALKQRDIGAGKRMGAYEDIGQTRFGTGGPSEGDQIAYGLAGQNRAKLGGWSDWALNQMISNIRTQDELNRISDWARGAQSLFPLRMYNAQHSGDELAFWGSLISSLGGGAGSFLSSNQGGSPAGGYFQQNPNQGYYGGMQGFDAGQGFGQQFAGYA